MLKKWQIISLIIPLLECKLHGGRKFCAFMHWYICRTWNNSCTRKTSKYLLNKYSSRVPGTIPVLNRQYQPQGKWYCIIIGSSKLPRAAQSGYPPLLTLATGCCLSSRSRRDLIASVAPTSLLGIRLLFLPFLSVLPLLCLSGSMSLLRKIAF